ncbi:SgrR family transcriptional regulator [Obesumbacterium proteus]|uniref:SgrR family transcriptional regulator n=1 Tax=Obesumbacterium proteus TaxID=82983 RepID=UPI001F3F5A11|nr:SgrR family transcriptional regulator [Obesumbacterium proteus]MCE9885620.1 SgrR family transcriptional regulator [Obesumbacterium proteus]MCE9914780.1 SgrR family transcriptional regulator [Obesumbacterium proteus]MCE9928522.1 SgrR family transcriptional regulator [Obesumbacterium proteus]MCG2876578.1 SgrR family transcriptional regulator [Obesumbacterium proteus]
MRLLQRLSQYQRLNQFAGDDPIQTTVAELAGVFCCSERHVRTLLAQLQELKWLEWHATAGRGKRARLHCVIPEQQLRANLMQQLLNAGDHQNALKLAERDPIHLNELLMPHLGGQWDSDLPTLRIPYYRTLEPIAPLALTGRAEQHLAHTIHAGLTRFETGNPHPQPDLAHHWQISADGLKWQFLLRSDLRWHNGQPITAEQLVQRLKQLLHHPRCGSFLSSIADISLPHALCIRFTLKCADYWLAHRLADLLCLLPHPDYPEIGAGPFRQISSSDMLIRLEQHSSYHLHRPYLHAIEYWITSNPEQASAAPSSQHPVKITIGQYEELDSVRPVQRSTSVGFCYIALNQKRGKLTVAQRRFLTTLIREENTLNHLPIENGLIERSSAMLSGWPLPEPTPEPISLPSKLTLLYHPPAELTALSDRLQERLAQAGCELEVRFYDGKRWESNAQFADVDIILGDRLIGESPEVALENWLRIDVLWQAILSDKEQQQCRTVLDGVQQLADETQRHHALRDYYTHLMQQSIIMPLFNYQYQISAPPRVEGVTLTAYGWFDFCRAWVPAPTDE